MTSKTQRDDNGYPSWSGISCVDGVTVVPIVFDSVTHGMTLDTTTVISIVPHDIMDDQGSPVVKGISSANAKKLLPLYVNPATGAVLADVI